MIDTIDRWMSRLANGRVLGAPVPLVILLLFFAANFATSALINDKIMFDDREQIVHMQSWAWGYKATQPPLHTWFVKTVDLFVGDDRVAVLAVRYLLLFGTTALFYSAGRLAGFSKPAAAACALGCLLLPQLAFQGLRMLSHSLTLVFGIALTINALLLVIRHGRPLDYLLLSLGVTVTILGKYNAVFVIAAFGLGAVSVEEIRRRFDLKWLAIAGALSAAMLAGPLLWLADNATEASRGIDLFHLGEAPSFLLARLEGTLSFARAFLLYAGLLLAVAVICIGIAGVRGLLVRNEQVAAPSLEERFLRNSYLGLLATAFVLVLVSGATFVKTPWMHPMVMLPVVIAPALSRYSRRDVLNGGIVFAALIAGLIATISVLVSKLENIGIL